ncbi:hypothetical protein A9G41_01290 [Gilliamella sp. Nev5-1]|nr:hypothetical protein A9G40_04215 [Gilliamella apicola]OCG66377.1 hypothetical protein A9G41_01290 [Gilliamella apicola]
MFEFVNTYNSCVDKLQNVKSQNLPWDKQSKLEQEIKKSYPCSQVRDAYVKRGMGYCRFDQKIEE